MAKATKPKATTGAKPAGKKSVFSKAPIRRLMKSEGADLVADSALILLISKLEEVALATTKKAVELMKDDKRKRITAQDIALATK